MTGTELNKYLLNCGLFKQPLTHYVIDNDLCKLYCSWESIYEYRNQVSTSLKIKCSYFREDGHSDILITIFSGNQYTDFNIDHLLSEMSLQDLTNSIEEVMEKTIPVKYKFLYWYINFIKWKTTEIREHKMNQVWS